MGDDNVVDLDGKRPMFGDNYQLASDFLEAFVALRQRATDRSPPRPTLSPLPPLKS
jgi:hypothetical protein